jgi:uncharacterized protein with HEPN domain
MVNYAEDAINFVADMDFASFEQDKRTHYAVVRAVEIVGEAAKNIPPSLKAQYPHIAWRSIAGMRDKVIHLRKIQIHREQNSLLLPRLR